MSAVLNSAALLQLRDAGDAKAISVTTGDGTEVFEDYAGQHVRLVNDTSDVVYVSAGSRSREGALSGTAVSAANGLPIAAGAHQDIYIPHRNWVLRHIAVSAGTLKAVPLGA